MPPDAGEAGTPSAFDAVASAASSALQRGLGQAIPGVKGFGGGRGKGPAAGPGGGLPGGGAGGAGGGFGAASSAFGAVALVFSGSVAAGITSILYFVGRGIQRRLYTTIYIDDQVQVAWVAKWLAANVDMRRRHEMVLRLDTGVESNMGGGRGRGPPGRRGPVVDANLSVSDEQRVMKPDFSLPMNASPVWLRLKSGRWAKVGFERNNKGQHAGAADPLTLMNNGGFNPRGGADKGAKCVSITVLGRDTQAAVDVLTEAYSMFMDSLKSNTTILRGNAGGSSAWGGGVSFWEQARSRPSRPLDTVVLNDDGGTRILNDVREFFESSEWYAERGLPYRRGYLVYGPPGTGKTSFALALAGELHCPICTVALNDPDLTDTKLLDLLDKAPERSIVLLEDIDSAFSASSTAGNGAAGMDHGPDGADSDAEGSPRPRRGDAAAGAESKGAPAENGASTASASVKGSGGGGGGGAVAGAAPPGLPAFPPAEGGGRGGGGFGGAGRGRGRGAPGGGPRGMLPGGGRRDGSGRDAAASGSGLSFSGLLNALDGVSAQEGKVVLATTNHLESLDEALVRAGRFDLKIEFKRATRDTARRLFERFYRGALDKKAPAGSVAASGATEAVAASAAESGAPSDAGATDDDGAMADGPVLRRQTTGDGTVSKLAVRFASAVEDYQYSCAQLTGFLMQYRKEPHAAADHAHAELAAAPPAPSAVTRMSSGGGGGGASGGGGGGMDAKAARKAAKRGAGGAEPLGQWRAP